MSWQTILVARRVTWHGERGLLDCQVPTHVCQETAVVCPTAMPFIHHTPPFNNVRPPNPPAAHAAATRARVKSCRLPAVFVICLLLHPPTSRHEMQTGLEFVRARKVVIPAKVV